MIFVFLFSGCDSVVEYVGEKTLDKKNGFLDENMALIASDDNQTTDDSRFNDDIDALLNGSNVNLSKIGFGLNIVNTKTVPLYKEVVVDSEDSLIVVGTFYQNTNMLEKKLMV